jgi:hypothetical protein
VPTCPPVFFVEVFLDVSARLFCLRFFCTTPVTTTTLHCEGRKEAWPHVTQRCAARGTVDERPPQYSAKDTVLFSERYGVVKDSEQLCCVLQLVGWSPGQTRRRPEQVAHMQPAVSEAESDGNEGSNQLVAPPPPPPPHRT